MDKPGFLALVRERTGQYQVVLDQCDEACSAGSQRQLGLQQEVAQCLQRFAATQLQLAGPLAPEISRELELRALEEQALRSQLGGLRAQLEQQRLSLEQAKAASPALPSIRVDDGADARDQLARALAAQAEHLAQQTELSGEIHRKLPMFSQDAIYTYLKGQGYGEAGYRGKGLVAMLDRWVAELSRFAANRRNEQALLAMQAELSERAGRHQSAVQAARQAVPRAGTEEQHQAALVERLAPMERAIQASEEELRRIRAQLEGYAMYSDARYLQASRMLADSLAGRPIEALAQLARDSATPDDDALVHQLDGLQDELARRQRELERAAQTRKQARAELASATALLQALQGARWEQADGEALSTAIDPDALLAAYIDGRLSCDEVLQQASGQRQPGVAA